MQTPVIFTGLVKFDSVDAAAKLQDNLLDFGVLFCYNTWVNRLNELCEGVNDSLGWNCKCGFGGVAGHLSWLAVFASQKVVLATGLFSAFCPDSNACSDQI